MLDVLVKENKWFWADNKNEKWFEKADELEKWMNVHDNIKPKSSGGPSFGKWFNEQQHLYKRGELTKEKIDRLEKIKGVDWIIPKAVAPKSADKLEGTFDNKLEEIADFVKEHKRKPSRRTGDKYENSLGDWLNRNYMSYKKKALKPSRVEKLKNFTVDGILLSEISESYTPEELEEYNRKRE